MAREPRVRAVAVHDALRLLDVFEPGLAQPVHSRIPAASLELIGNTAAQGWIPAEHDHFVPASIVEALGDSTADRYFRWLLGRHLETSSLKPLFESTLRLFGVDPGSFVRAVPVGWPVVYRDFGDPRVVERGPQFAILDLENCAPEVFEYPGYVQSWTGFFSGFYDLSHFEGAAQAKVDEARRAIRFSFEW